MKENLVIIGASGHGKVIADIAIQMNCWKEIFFLDDDEAIEECLGIKVVGKSSDALKYKGEACFFVAIGNNEIREKVQRALEEQDMPIATLVHPNAVIGTDVELGAGTAVMAGAVINSSSRIGKACIINTNSTIDHDNDIGEYVHISPGVSVAGNVSIGKGTWLGIGSVVSNNISICDNCVIGAGAVVVKDVCSGGAYIGVPAKRI